MVGRLLNISKQHSFFLFGARGTGKSRLIDELFSEEEALFIHLLLPKTFDALLRNPESLLERIKAASKPWVVLDEVQKLPVLLDVVHYAIEKLGIRFALTGSSARKLKRGGANLLAGRALVYYLFPFTAAELGTQFSLSSALQFGLLPKIALTDTDIDKRELLDAYVQTYIKEEILVEQIIRTLPPFRRFLEVAAQMSGEIVNFAGIASDVGVDDKTVKSYYQVLEDTLIGYFLDSFHRSLRKSQRVAPRFFFFDEGVANYLADRIEGVTPSSFGYGKRFEHFLINQFVRHNSYRRANFKLSYLRTQTGAEVDLILTRGKEQPILIEIKSGAEISGEDVRHLARFLHDLPGRGYCLSRDRVAKEIQGIRCLYWEEGLQEIFAPEEAGN